MILDRQSSRIGTLGKCPLLVKEAFSIEQFLIWLRLKFIITESVRGAEPLHNLSSPLSIEVIARER